MWANCIEHEKQIEILMPLSSDCHECLHLVHWNDDAVVMQKIARNSTEDEYATMVKNGHMYVIKYLKFFSIHLHPQMHWKCLACDIMETHIVYLYKLKHKNDTIISQQLYDYLMAHEEESWAQNALGTMYRKGFGVEKDAKKTFAYYAKSALQGNWHGYNKLACCYHRSVGTEQDHDKAYQWLNKAILEHEQEQHQGTPVPSSIYFNFGFCFYKGEGATKDFAKAVEYFTKAANMGNSKAQHMLALCYETGKGANKSPELAYCYYVRAASQGRSASQYRLARLHLMGSDVIQVPFNTRLAYQWLHMAARQNHIQAQALLATMYEHGTEDNVFCLDLLQSLIWFQKSARSGYQYAKQELKRIAQDYNMCTHVCKVYLPRNTIVHVHSQSNLLQLFGKGTSIWNKQCENYQSVTALQCALPSNMEEILAARANAWIVVPTLFAKQSPFPSDMIVQCSKRIMR